MFSPKSPHGKQVVNSSKWFMWQAFLARIESDLGAGRYSEWDQKKRSEKTGSDSSQVRKRIK